MKKTILITIALLAYLNAFTQTNYYVDPIYGNDTNSGTSLGTAWKTIQKACNAAIPNSIVQIKAGTYNENIVANVSGTPGNSITFKNYMSDVVLIDGTSTSGTTMLSITNKNYLNFQNLTIQNLTVNGAKGIFVETTGSATSTSLSFKNIIIKNINWTSSASTIPSATDNAQGFIALGRDGGIANLTIDSCQAFNNILGFSEAISLDGNINGFTVKNCLVHDNTNIGICLIGNYSTCSIPASDHARHGVVINNQCNNNVSLYATSAGIYVDGGWSITVEKNKCYHNGNGIELGCEQNGTADSITVKNNIVYDNQNVGIYVGGYTTATTGQVLNCIIRNNTFFQNNYANDGTGEIAISKASSCVFENNIFYTSSQNVFMSVDNILPQANNILNYNCWFNPSSNPDSITVNWKTSTYNTFSSYQAGTFQEVNSIFNNPNINTPTLIALDLHILAGSPCINTGKPATVITFGERDYDGNARIIGDTIDIGAYEYYGTAGINSAMGTGNAKLFIYPNPITSEKVLFINTELKNALFQAFDIVGKKRLEVKNIFGQQIIINREILTPGVYFYKITQDNKIIADGKFIAK